MALDGDVTASDYGADRPGSGQVVTTFGVTAIAASAALGVWSAGSSTAIAIGGAIGAGCVLCGGRGRLAVVCVVVALIGSWRSADAWSGLVPDQLGPFEGWVRLVDDPQPFGSSTRLIVEVEGERFETWVRRTGQRERVAAWRAGQWVSVAGERRPLDRERAGRVAWQHVVGEFRLRWAGDVESGDAIARASNRRVPGTRAP